MAPTWAGPGLLLLTKGPSIRGESGRGVTGLGGLYLRPRDYLFNEESIPLYPDLYFIKLFCYSFLFSNCIYYSTVQINKFVGKMPLFVGHDFIF